MIYIIRHGQTGLNKAQQLQGRSDTALNEKGREQAEEASAFFEEKGIHFDHVFSSPLVRALETAGICAPYAVPAVDERLIEMDYGPYEGCDLKNPPAEIIAFSSDFVHNPAPEGMEQLSDVVRRAGNFLEDIRHLKGNILISTHAIAMKGLLEYLTPDSKGAYWSKYIGNCAVYCADNQNGGYTVPRETFWSC
jgi:broad specificity phosphatase PhoE